MRPLVAFLVLAALATATPLTALGEPGGGHGRGGGGGWHGGGGGGWRGGGGPERGAPPFEREGGVPYGGGRWRGEPPVQPEPVPGGGRWGGRYPAGPEGGPVYAEPRGRNSNSLGEYYREQQDEAREGVRRGGYRTMGQVMQSIRQRTPGRPLDAGLEQWSDGRPVYRVRWGAADGRRVDYIIDARTGAILQEEH